MRHDVHLAIFEALERRHGLNDDFGALTKTAIWTGEEYDIGQVLHEFSRYLHGDKRIWDHGNGLL